MALFGRPILAEDASSGAHPVSETPEEREHSVRDDLLRRLRTVCEHLPEEEFQELVAAMTREQLRSERRV